MLFINTWALHREPIVRRKLDHTRCNLTMTRVCLFSRLYIFCQGGRRANLVEPDEALLVEELEALLLRGLLVDLVHLGRALGKELRGEVQQAVPRVPGKGDYGFLMGTDKK